MNIPTAMHSPGTKAIGSNKEFFSFPWMRTLPVGNDSDYKTLIRLGKPQKERLFKHIGFL